MERGVHEYLYGEELRDCVCLGYGGIRGVRGAAEQGRLKGMPVCVRGTLSQHGYLSMA